MIPTQTKKQDSSQEGEEVVALHKAIKSVQTVSQTQRPLICFLCVGNPSLAMKN